MSLTNSTHFKCFGHMTLLDKKLLLVLQESEEVYSSSDCTACEPFVEWQFTAINLVDSFVL